MDISAAFVESPRTIVRVVLLGLTGYVSLLVLLRVSGKRTLSKMTLFDWVVTLALASVYATAFTNDTMTYPRLLASLGTLVGAQWLVTWVNVRSETFADLVKPRPTILYYRGRYLERAMRRARVPASEIRSAFRQNGVGDPDAVTAVVLDANGQLIVLSAIDVAPERVLGEADNWEAVRGTGG